MPNQAKVRKDSFAPLPLHMSQPKKTMAEMTNRLKKVISVEMNLNHHVLFTQMQRICIIRPVVRLSKSG